MYHRFLPVAIGVEKNSIGLATLQYLQVTGLPIYDVNADADKYSRAIPIAMRYKAGMVYHRSRASTWIRLSLNFRSSRKGRTMIMWTWPLMLYGA